MKKLGKRCLIPALVLSLILSSGAVRAVAGELDEARDKKSNLEDQKAETQEMLDDLETMKDDTISYIRALDKQLSTYESQISELESKIDETQKELEETKEALKKAKEDERQQYESMKKRMLYIYMNGGNSEYFQILFSSQSISDFLNKSEYVKMISDYDRNMLTNYQKAKDKVAQKELTIKTKMEELKDLKAKAQDQKATVEKLISNKNKELEKYNNSIDKSEQAVQDYQEAIQQQEDEIEQILEEERRAAELAARQAAQNQGHSVGSISMTGFMWPVPSSIAITCGFGYRDAPTAGASTNHKGMDIGASTGAAIVATKAGTVVKASYSVAGGNFVMISHGGGVYSYYMHCSELLVQSGQTVTQGQTIALVGSTGVSTGPHLHFALTVNGGYVDPENYVSY